MKAYEEHNKEVIEFGQPDEPLQRKTSADPLLPDQYIGHQTRKRKNLDV